MKLHPRIEILEEKKMVGIYKTMSLTNNLTFQLWNEFGPQIKTINNKTSEDKISLQVYGETYFNVFDPSKEFVKWALVEVLDLENIPFSLSPFTLSGGRYAVFDFKGSGNISAFFHYIFSNWIPKSEYQLDNRPHFEVLGEKYKKDDPESEEEIWIPIRKR